MTVLRRFRRYAVFLLVLGMLLPAGCRTWTGREERAAVAYNRGNELRDRGLYDEAVEAYRESLSEDPDFRAAAFNMALALVESRRPEEALEELENLRIQDPSNLIILNAMGWAAWHARDIEASLGWYDTVLDIFATDATALYGKAEVLDSAGRHTEAVPVWQTIVELEDDNAARGRLAASLFDSGDPKAALTQYRVMLVESPEDIEVLVGAALSAAEASLADEELTYRKRLVEISSDNDGDDYFRITRLLLLEFGNYEEGINALKKALEAGFADEDSLNRLLVEIAPSIRPAYKRVLDEAGF